MKKTAYLLAALLAFASCNWLDTTPQDNYSSESYWKTASQAEAYLSGIYDDLRSVAFNHVIRFGELGSGIYRAPASTNTNEVADQPIINHTLSADVPGVEAWGGLYSAIADCNLFIDKVSWAGYLEEDEKSCLLAQVHGLRALLYFDLYRIYGGVPLRLEPDIADGSETDVRKMYLARSSASKTMEQIMQDVDLSLELFGSNDSFAVCNLGKRICWSKAASQCLAAEILLWNTKVSVGDYAARADGSLLPRARELLEEVASRNDIALEENFADIFDTSNKAGKEIIFALHYGIGEAVNGYGNFLYHTSTGQIHNMYRRDGSPFGDPLSLGSGYNQTYEYIPEMYLQYEGTSVSAGLDAPLDNRADASFIGIFDDSGAGLELKGTVCSKNPGEVSAGTRVLCGDIVLYRLAWVYLTLAEIANWQGDAAAFEENLNAVRARAYGSNWNGRHSVQSGSFKENELAILKEKDKEFILEGQRWWDLRRMQTVRGDESSHLLFQGEGNPVQNKGAVLGEAFRVLWPLSTDIRANDPELSSDEMQNPGY